MPTVEKESLCLFCEFFFIDTGWGGTDVTPGEPAEICCRKEHWAMDISDTTGLFRLYIKRAAGCGDFNLKNF